VTITSPLSTPGPTPTGSPLPATPTPSPASGVLGITTIGTPNTGSGLMGALITGALMMLFGSAAITVARRRSKGGGR